MLISGQLILAAIAIGVGATLLMDVWNVFLRRAFGIPSLNYCLLGRWVGHMPKGVFSHASITAAAPARYECVVGWISHYSIGVLMSLGFAVLTAGASVVRPTFLPALLYGIGTVIFPFFIMQPSLGLGVAGSRTPDPSRARLKSLATHAVFGCGLYVCAEAIRSVLRP